MKKTHSHVQTKTDVSITWRYEMKVTRYTKIYSAVWGHVCPLCGKILSSASDPEYLPEFAICDCDKNGNSRPVFELYEQDGNTMIRRNKPPRFVGKVVFGQTSVIELIELIDEATVEELARAMRKAGEFLIKKSNYARKADK